MGVWQDEKAKMLKKRDRLLERMDAAKSPYRKEEIRESLLAVDRRIARLRVFLGEVAIERSDARPRSQVRTDARADDANPRQGVLDARDRREAFYSQLPAGKREAQAFFDAAQAAADKRRRGAADDDAPPSKVFTIGQGDDAPQIAVCPGCDGAGELPVDEEGETMESCATCDGQRVVAVKKLGRADAAAGRERLQTALGYFGGSQGRYQSDPGAPFGPAPKGGTPRDEEAELRGAAAAVKVDGGVPRVMINRGGELGPVHAGIPMPQPEHTSAAPTQPQPAPSRARVEAARDAREQRMQSIAFGRADARKVLLERLRAASGPLGQGKK